jgi:ankyrin repeat protein
VEDARLTLTAAVCLGRTDDIARLAPESSAQEKQKALAAAAYNARLDAIGTAIALGADLNAPNLGLNPNATALHNAVCSGSLAAVRKLVEAGADVGARDGPYQGTPLDWAEYFVRERGAGEVEYFQRDGPSPKQYSQIAAYLRSKEGGSRERQD